VVEQGGHVVGVRVLAARQRAVAVAAQVGAHDAEHVAQGRDERLPHAPVGHAGVQQEDERSVTVDVVREDHGASVGLPERIGAPGGGRAANV
jgi:hypothetical protein